MGSCTSSYKLQKTTTLLLKDNSCVNIMSVAIFRALISVQGTSCKESDKCWQLWGWDGAGRVHVVQTDREGEADRPNNDQVGVLVQTGVGKSLP